MSNRQASIDQTVTLLKIQALLAGAQELTRQTGSAKPRPDTKFLSYLIKMARMEAEACFETPEPGQRNPQNRDDLDRM